MRRLAAAGAALAVLAGLVGGLAQLRVDTGTEQFLPSGAASVAATADEARAFGGDPIVVLARSAQPESDPRRSARPGPALLTDPDQLLRLLRLEGDLARTPDVAAVYGPATVLNQVVGAARGLLAQVAGRRDGARQAAQVQATQAGADPADAAAAGQAAAEAVDARYAPLVVAALPAGVPTLRNPAFVRAAILDPDGSPKPRWRFVVPAPDAVAVLVRPREGLDQAGTARLVDGVRSQVAAAGLETTSTTVAGVPVVTSGLATAVVRDLPLLAGLVALVVAVRFWLVPAVRRRGRATPAADRSPVADSTAARPEPPPGSDHGRGDRWRAVLWPLAVAALGASVTPAVAGWLGVPLSFGAIALLPALLGVGTSFLLYLASARDRRPMVVMGLAAAAGFAALAVSPLPFVRQLGLVLGLGVGLTVGAGLALRRYAPAGSEDLPATAAGGAEPPPRPRPVGVRLAAAALVVVAGLGWAALAGLGVTANPLDLARGTPQLDDARAADRVLGSSGEITVVLRGPDVLSPPALAWSRTVSRQLLAAHGDQLRPVISLPDQLGFLGDAPTAAQIRDAAALLPDYLRSAVVTSDDHTSLVTVGLSLDQELRTQADLVRAIRAGLPPVPPGYTAELAGLPVAAADGYATISAERYPATLAGIAAVGLVLGLGLRRRREALRAVAAAVLATGWGYALMWVTGIRPTVLTLALGALVAVSAAEFVVLLRLPGTGDARRHRRSVAVAAATAAVGYAALAASRLWVLRDFGLVLTGSVALAYLAALLVTAPAVAGVIPRRRRRPAGGGGAPHAVATTDRDRTEVPA
ncbi:RND transporter [Actinomycetospora sp. TBRC 11914]|uniref:RND transporter n=1 Tax=Actinomycetospora sp. TBRC 11914 TaxID=2729387 RepID=UPI00145C5F9A|nr:RND transporter [Actinomycetospora sp. TBRC 11914]NMO91483.1 RND transporter [Actinomycetospora sp. TBRC 11914]